MNIPLDPKKRHGQMKVLMQTNGVTFPETNIGSENRPPQ